MASVAAVCRIVERRIALALSASPPTARNPTASTSEVVRPKPIMASPQRPTASTTARPIRSTRPIQPEVSPPSTAPIPMPAFSRPRAVPPSGGPPKVCWAICGNNARGIPATIAMMSTTNEASRIFCVAR